MILKKVISGGQRGADQGGLAAAKDMGLITGGWVPYGWKTLNGSMPMLEKLGCKQHTSPNYKPRTFKNVKESDGTIRLAYDFNSPGERCTLKAIEFYGKPHYDIDLNDPDFIFDVTDWINKHHIAVLNVAGNAGHTKAQGNAIFKQVRQYLGCVFRAYREEDK